MCGLVRLTHEDERAGVGYDGAGKRIGRGLEGRGVGIKATVHVEEG